MPTRCWSPHNSVPRHSLRHNASLIASRGHAPDAASNSARSVGVRAGATDSLCNHSCASIRAASACTSRPGSPPLASKMCSTYPRRTRAYRTSARSETSFVVGRVMAAESHLATAFEGLRERHLVRVLQIASDRKTGRETRDPDPDRLQHRRDVHGSGVALEVRVRREDHLGHVVAFHPLEQLLDAQILWADAVERTDSAAEDVITALDQRGLLDGGGVLRFFDDAQHRPVAGLVAAHSAKVALRDVAALSTEEDPFLGLHDGRGQALGILGRRLHEPERQPLGGLRPDPRQPSELVDQLLDRALVRHALARLVAAVGGDLRAEHLFHAAKRFFVRRWVLLVDDLHHGRSATWIPRVPDDADDLRADAEQIAERLLQDALPIRHLLHAEPLVRWEREGQHVAFKARDGRTLEERSQHLLADLSEVLHEGRP